jgi:hypothetical protein
MTDKLEGKDAQLVSPRLGIYFTGRPRLQDVWDSADRTFLQEGHHCVLAAALGFYGIRRLC